MGLRGYLAARQLMLAGFEVYNITGGFKSFREFLAAQQLQGSTAARL